MPLLVLLVLVILIAQIGFWDTLSAIVGGVLMLVVLAALGLLLVVLALRWAMTRARG